MFVFCPRSGEIDPKDGERENETSFRIAACLTISAAEKMTDNTTGGSAQVDPVISYLISTSENDLGRVCWEIKDTHGRLIFKSFKGLTQNEIVESIQDLSGESLWSIHRPTKGWYLALRSPKVTTSPNFIALEPRNVTEGKNRMVEFTFRMKPSSITVPSLDKPANGLHKHSNPTSSIKRRHPSISSSPVSPKQSTSRAPSPDHQLQQQLPLDPLVVRLQPVDKDLSQSSIFKSFTDLFLNNNQRIECFIDSSIISPLDHNGIESLNSTTNTHSIETSLNRLILFDYEDQNSVFGIQNNGILKLHLNNTVKLHLLDDPHHLNDSGFHQAFWVSVCIAYLGFRADQDAYVAAIQGD